MGGRSWTGILRMGRYDETGRGYVFSFSLSFGVALFLKKN